MERRRGKQPGTPGANLSIRPDPDEIVDHVPTHCGSCGDDLSDAPVEGVERRQGGASPPLRQRAASSAQQRGYRCVDGGGGRRQGTGGRRLRQEGGRRAHAHLTTLCLPAQTGKAPVGGSSPAGAATRLHVVVPNRPCSIQPLRPYPILPATATYHWLGFLEGNAVSVDAKWASVFLANFHFASIGTQYFASETPPSPLQHMWSLSVEEQFYAVWPMLMILVTLIARRVSLRLRVAVVLGAIAVASFTWSIVETAQNGVWAYFSPLTRAWELAAGGLIAVAGPLVARIPRTVALVMGYLGLIGIVASGVLVTSMSYPGDAVALPVLSTVVVIVAGSVVAGKGVELLLRHVRCSGWELAPIRSTCGTGALRAPSSPRRNNVRGRHVPAFSLPSRPRPS